MNEFQSAICKRKTGKERSEDLEEKKRDFCVHSSEIFMGYSLLNQ